MQANFLCGIHPRTCKENAGLTSFCVLKTSFCILKTSFGALKSSLGILKRSFGILKRIPPLSNTRYKGLNNPILAIWSSWFNPNFVATIFLKANSHYSLCAKKLDLCKIAVKSSFMINKSSFRRKNRVSQFSGKSSFTQNSQKISLLSLTMPLRGW